MSSASQAQINQALVNQVVTISQEAGKAIMAVYQSSRDMEINYKADDSPLTQADLAAHRVLVAALPQLLPIH